MSQQAKRVCPKCESKMVIQEGGGFIERGNFNGKQYEVEGNVDRFVCQEKKCGHEFFEMSK
ncbi:MULTISPECIES: hypothetical protein [Paenibacillus]|uniref:hypothetical protein n=1 Tax=Paenibacillus TaxID=44249 RepID=UPI000B5962D7|nr:MULTISPECIES: hypothetical protein [Paenibacillus]